MEPLILIILILLIPAMAYFAYAIPIAGPITFIIYMLLVLSPIYTFDVPGASFMTSPSYGYSDEAIYPPGHYLKVPFSKNPTILSTTPVDYTIKVTTQTSDNMPFNYYFDILDVSFIPDSYQTQFGHNVTNFINYYTPYIQDQADKYFNTINSHDLYFHVDNHRNHLLSIIESDKRFTNSILSHFTRGGNTPHFFNSRVGLGDDFTHKYIREELPAQFAMADAATQTINTPTHTLTSTTPTDFPYTEPTINPSIPQKYGTQEDIDNTVYNVMIKEGRLNPDRSMNRAWYSQHPNFHDEWNTEHPNDLLSSTPKIQPRQTPVPNSVTCDKNGYCNNAILKQIMQELDTKSLT